MLRKFCVYSSTYQVDKFRRSTVILLPKISNPLADFTCIPSYKPPFIKYIFLLPSSTSAYTHNNVFIFQLVFIQICSFIVLLSTFRSALSFLFDSYSTRLFINISFILQFSLFYHMHLILIFSLHINFVVVSSTAFCC